jgi:hypothetical protein
MKLNIITFLLLGSVISTTAFSNETNRYFGDRSWKWKTDNNKLIDNQRLQLRCLGDPSKCKGTPNGANGSNGSNGSSSGLGLGLASGQNIGNNITIVVQGDNNVITLNGDQSNSGSQSVDLQVKDNTLDIEIDSSSHIINGTSNTTNNTTNTSTTTNTTTKNIDNHNHSSYNHIPHPNGKKHY